MFQDKHREVWNRIEDASQILSDLNKKSWFAANKQKNTSSNISIDGFEQYKPKMQRKLADFPSDQNVNLQIRGEELDPPAHLQ